VRLSIVTPSYNQARFLQEAIDSVLNQNYDDVEYLIMDGGSKDLSVEIIKTYGDKIQWVSEPDGGQSAAVNKGILRATGDIIGWLNSDDIYYPNVFGDVMHIFQENPKIQVLYGDADHVYEDGSYMEDYYTEPWNYERLQEICFLCQPAVFFRRSAVMEIGLLNPDRNFSMDYDLWLRLGKKYEFYYYRRKLAKSRLYAENKTLGCVDLVHIDIMDTLLENTGRVSDRWIHDGAVSIIRRENLDVSTPQGLREYRNLFVAYNDVFRKRYQKNKHDALDRMPYSFHDLQLGIDISIAPQVQGMGIEKIASPIVNNMIKLFPESRFLLFPRMNNLLEKNSFRNSRVFSSENVSLPYGRYREQITHASAVFESGNSEEIASICGFPNVVLYPSITFLKKLNFSAASVYILYDLAFLEMSEYMSKECYSYCYDQVFSAALYADCFLAVSEFTKQQFIKYFSFVDPDRIEVIPLGYWETYNKQEDWAILSDLHIGSNPFWLSMVPTKPYNNLKMIIQAYARLVSDHDTYPLIIVGDKENMDSEIYQYIEKQGLQDIVKFLGNISEEQLNALYHICYAMIDPSLYDGFNMSLVEAMAGGAPVLSSNTASMPEIGEDAVMYYNHQDAQSIYEAMQKLELDPELRARMIEKGKERVTKYTWKDCVENIYRALYRAVSIRFEPKLASSVKKLIIH